MVPLPFRIEGSLGAPLQRLATVAGACVLQIFGLPAFSSGNVIVIDDFRIGVIEACNGLGMAYMFLACSAGAALLFPRSYLDRAILIASAIPIALAANVARIVATGLLHELVGGRIAGAVYHDLAGWLMMLMTLVILWLECKLIPHLFIATTPDNPDTVATTRDLLASHKCVVARTNSPPIVPGLVALSLVIATAIVTGQWANRWKTSHELEVAAARLDRLPLMIGDWAGRAQPIDPREMTAAEVDGFLSRRYDNRRTGSRIGVLLVCGRPGPVAVHTPDVCYPGAGYEMAQTQPQKSALKLGAGHADADFLWAQFRHGGSITRDGLLVWWSWNSTNKWSAPDNARLAFADQPFLYKLYVISEITGQGDPADIGAETDFLRQLLPELEKVLFPPPEPITPLTLERANSNTVCQGSLAGIAMVVAGSKAATQPDGRGLLMMSCPHYPSSPCRLFRAEPVLCEAIA
jgi:exosortase/archaeosortase family protein